MATNPLPTSAGRSTSGLVLLTLAAGSFLMALDSSVMNVSIASVANDVHTNVTGIQLAITLYTLVMASCMISGARLGEMLGRKRAFAIGAVIYGAGSFTTAIATNLTVLILGWSLLEGIGAALILPAIVSLVASNFTERERPKAYGAIAASSAVAIAVGPLIGGLCATYLSWRYVFAGEVFVVVIILLLTRRIADVAPEPAKLDFVGTLLSIVGLGSVVIGILKSGTWGVIQPKAGAPSWLGLSLAIWLILAGGLVIAGFAMWESHLTRVGKQPLVDVRMLANRALQSGLVAFFFQFLAQMGLFFTVPLYLSVALGLSAIETGVRILPLSVGLLLSAPLIPRVFPRTSARRIVRLGFLALFAGIVILVGALEVGSGPGIVLLPLFLAGIGMGALASQLGAVTVASVSERDAGAVGGLQNTMTNLGASVGTALAGAVLIASLTTTFVAGLDSNPNVSSALTQQATVKLAGGAPFVSDDQLQRALQTAGVAPGVADAIVATNTDARLAGLRSALGVLALLVLVGLMFSGGIPTAAAGSASPPTPDTSEASGSESRANE